MFTRDYMFTRVYSHSASIELCVGEEDEDIAGFTFYFNPGEKIPVAMETHAAKELCNQAQEAGYKISYFDVLPAVKEALRDFANDVSDASFGTNFATWSPNELEFTSMGNYSF